jgi:hypothetical protein
LANLEAIVRVFQERGVGVALASFAYPDPAKMRYVDRLYFNDDAHYSWNTPSLACYVRTIQLLNDDFKDLSARRGLPFIPVAEEMRGEPSYFLDVCHMNDAGIARKADIFYRHIKDYVADRLSHGDKKSK